MSSDAHNEVIIHAEGVGKCYELFQRPSDRLKQLLWGRWRNYGRSFWALQDVNFTVRRGEVVGLVGRNGAGKSTLLQMVCGTLQPTVGRIDVKGRIAALLELGAGFNPDFSGIENVYMNAALLGMTRDQVDARMDEILAFADIGDFVHQPVKTYSSGMFVRLAFAVATSVDPEILVVDEALSVGDGAFARKSFDRVMQMRERGAAVLFCSHSMYQIQALCSKALWIEAGQVRMADSAAKVTSAYETFLMTGQLEQGPTNESAASAGEPEKPLADADLPLLTDHTAKLLRITAATSDGQMGKDLRIVNNETDLQIDVAFRLDATIPAPSVAFVITHLSGVTVTSGLKILDDTFLDRHRGIGQVQLKICRVPLLQGDYYVDFYLGCERGLQLYDQALRDLRLTVVQNSLERGLVTVPCEWLLSK